LLVYFSFAKQAPSLITACFSSYFQLEVSLPASAVDIIKITKKK